MSTLRDQITYVNKTFHDSIAPWYDSNQEQYHEKVIAYNRQLLSRVVATLPNKALHILDIACGTGYLGQFIDTNKHIVNGIDISKKMISIAKKKYPAASYSIQDVYSYKSQKKFDLVMGNAALHHFEDYETVIKRVTTLLLPHGCIFFSAEPNYYCYHYLSIFKKLIRLRHLDHRKIRSTNKQLREDLAEYHMYQKDGIHPYKLRTFLYALGYKRVNLYFSSREFFAGLIDRMNVHLIDYLPDWFLDGTGIMSRTFTIVAYKYNKL